MIDRDAGSRENGKHVPVIWKWRVVEGAKFLRKDSYYLVVFLLVSAYESIHAASSSTRPDTVAEEMQLSFCASQPPNCQSNLEGVFVCKLGTNV